MELYEILTRLVETLRETDQLEDTLIFVSSDNGPHMETWPDLGGCVFPVCCRDLA